MRPASPFRDLGQAEFKVRVSEQEREDLALLLETQDGQQGCTICAEVPPQARGKEGGRYTSEEAAAASGSRVTGSAMSSSS